MVLPGLSLRLARTAGRGFALGDVRLGNTSDRRSPGAVSFPEIALHEVLGLGTAIWGIGLPRFGPTQKRTSPSV